MTNTKKANGNTILGYKPLTVYKASAGSGKTFTLAVEYISILASNPDNYRHILAVTFTNKATQEMKHRILSQLYGIAYSLPTSANYLEKVLEQTGLAKEVVQANTKKALALLTHHYNFFRVQTIDAFFQSVLRNLAHELDLTANLRVDLNDEEVVEHAVDNLLENLDSHKELLGWIQDYINHNIEDDHGWNVIASIKQFGMNLFRESYKEHEESLNTVLASENGKFIPRYIALLRNLRNEWKRNISTPARNIITAMQQNHINEPALYRRGLYSYITKRSMGEIDNIPTPPTAAKAISSEKGWPSSKCQANDKLAIECMAQEQGVKLLTEMEDLRKNGWEAYGSAILTLSHLSELRLLNAIATAVEESNRTANRFMLNSTQTLLHGIIKASDTPFIYEKIGVQLRHIMIDEFQDTSQIQWRNFKVLLDNCMAQENSHNLIVGDIKQSIYRWRQGDWRLLNNLPHFFGTAAVNTRTLDTNYRSWERIVTFNNVFFSKLIQQTAEELLNDGVKQAEFISTAYSDATQHYAKGKDKGYIEMNLLPSKDYEEEVLKTLAASVQQLLENGVQQKDIAILVRSKSPVQLIADYFTEEFGQNVRIVSDEAFRLDASLAVNVLILSLKLLAHPNDNLTRAALAKMYQQYVLNIPHSISSMLISKEEMAHTTINKAEHKRIHDTYQRQLLDSFLPEGFVKGQNTLRAMPLIDLVNRLYALFQLNSLHGQSAYVCLFYDILSDYLRDYPADIDDFLTEWENSFAQKTIQSDEIDGVRIFTIHKSKGLEFDNVIIPFCDWQLEKSNTIWCENDNRPKPFDTLPIIPITYSRTKMLGTVYEPDYREEHFQNVIDNLNLLYVAFTRAGKRLFITGKRTKDIQKKLAEGITSNRSQAIELCIEQVAKELGDSCTLQGKDEPNAPLRLVYGSLEVEHDIRTKEVSQNPFEVTASPIPIQIESFPRLVGFRQSNKSEEFIRGEEMDSKSKTYIKTGAILHQLFSTIKTLEDIEPHLKMLEENGVITDQQILKQLRDHIYAALRHSTVAEWFKPKWMFFNECTILEYDAKNDQVMERRPDRVMSDGQRIIVVDFKFGKPRPEYAEQVSQYMQLLHKMGHSNVEGYLWYVLQGQVEAIENNILPSAS